MLTSEQLLVNQGPPTADVRPHRPRTQHVSPATAFMRFICCWDWHAERRKLERVCPPWLHVLLPPRTQEEEEISKSGAAARGLSDLRKLNEIRHKISSQRPVRLQSVAKAAESSASGANPA